MTDAFSDFLYKRTGLHTADAQTLSRFCLLMSTLLESGLTVTECLKICSEQFNNTFSADILAVREKIYQGSTLETSLKSYARSFPSMLCEMVGCAERASSLPEAFSQLSAYYEDTAKSQREIKDALRYPALLLLMLICVIIFLSQVVLPVFEHSIQNQPLPAVTRIVIVSGHVLPGLLFALFCAVLGFWMYFQHRRSIKECAHHQDYLLLKIPVIGKICHCSALYFSAIALEMLSSVGLTPYEALDIASRVSINQFIGGELQTARKKILLEGIPLSQALADSACFKGIYTSLIRIAEKSGHYEEMFCVIKKHYKLRLGEYIKSFTDSLQPIMLTIIGIVVCFVILSFLLPNLQMYESMLA